MIRRLLKLSKKINVGKLTDFLIVVLVLIALILGYKIYRQSPQSFNILKERASSLTSRISLPKLKRKEPPQTAKPQEVPSARVFPPDFTEEEKIVLVPQTDDVPKDEHLKWDETLRKIAQKADFLTLYRYADDCFGKPVVFKAKRGEGIKVKNVDESEITLGMGEQNWTIPPKGEAVIRPEFKLLPEMTTKGASYGYGCGFYESAPSGLFFVE